MVAKLKISNHFDGSFCTSHFMDVIDFIHSQVDWYVCVDFKKNAQCESHELSFIWGKMRIASRETVLQYYSTAPEAAGGSVCV